MRALVLEGHVFQLEIGIRGNLPDLLFIFGFFVFHIMDFVQTFRADLGVLRGLNESYELRNRTVQLSQNILHGHHHPEGHIPFDDRFGRDKRNQYVFGLVDEQAAHLLRLPEGHRFDTDTKHFGLNPLPFPAFLFLATVQFDLLHAVDQLHQAALVVGSLLKPFIVQFLSFFQKYDDPSGVQGAAQQENPEDRQVVGSHDRPVNDERKARKYDIQKRSHQKTLDAAVVPDPLHDVAHHLHVEERDRKPHQFRQKIGDERNADPGSHVQRQPALNQPVRRLPERQGHLCDQDGNDKSQIAVVDSVIDDPLCQKREDQADHAAGQHGEEKLDDEFSVWPQIIHHIPDAKDRLFGGIVFLFVKAGRRFDDQRGADREVIFPGRIPTLQEILFIVFQQPARRVGYIDPVVVFLARLPVLFDVVDHDEVPLFPVNDQRERNVVAQLFPRQLDSFGTETDQFGRIADAQHRNALAGNMAFGTQRLERVVFTVEFGDHAQTGRAAVHRV